MGEVSALRPQNQARQSIRRESEYRYKRCLCKTKKNHDIITYAHANACVIAKGMSTKHTKGTKNANHGAPWQAFAHTWEFILLVYVFLISQLKYAENAIKITILQLFLVLRGWFVIFVCFVDTFPEGTQSLRNSSRIQSRNLITAGLPAFFSGYAR